MNGFDGFIKDRLQNEENTVTLAQREEDTVSKMLIIYVEGNLFHSEFLKEINVKVSKLENGYALANAANGFVINTLGKFVRFSGGSLGEVGGAIPGLTEAGSADPEFENTMNDIVLRILRQLKMFKD